MATKPEAEAQESPKPLTQPESVKALRDHIHSLQVLLARGSKSDIDQIGARLQELLDWLDALADDKRPNPRSVASINETK